VEQSARATKKIASRKLNYVPGQGIIEEVLSLWNENRLVLTLTGQHDARRAVVPERCLVCRH
jgi:hypothetical protein